MPEILTLDDNYKPQTLIFTLPEAKALYRILSHYYIPYEDREAHKAVDKIMKFIKENQNELSKME